MQGRYNKMAQFWLISPLLILYTSSLLLKIGIAYGVNQIYVSMVQLMASLKG